MIHNYKFIHPNYYKVFTFYLTSCSSYSYFMCNYAISSFNLSNYFSYNSNFEILLDSLLTAYYSASINFNFNSSIVLFANSN